MIFADIFGQVFRDSTGMPTKVSTYNVRLIIYEGISNDISEIEKSSIEYLNNSDNIDWRLNDAKRIKLYADFVNGFITAKDYSLLLDDLDYEKKQIFNDFVSSTDFYFVNAYRNKLYSEKKKHIRDSYISLMKFDTWFDMEEARELADLATLQIRTSDKYVDAKRIAEIRDKYMIEKKMRRG